jgi:small conductance mechanosensitive channel
LAFEDAHCANGPGRKRRAAGDNRVNHFASRIARALSSSLLVLGTLSIVAAAAVAQSFPGLPFSSPVPAGPETSAPIVLDGQTLFTVAAGNARDQVPVATRAADIESILSQLVATTGSGLRTRTDYDPKSLRILIERHAEENALEAIDDHHRNPLPIVTVTSTDAQLHGESDEALAAEWQETLQGSLEQALLVRQPGAEENHLLQASILVAALAIVSFCAYAIVRRLNARIDRLAEDVDRHTAQIEETKEEGASEGAPEGEQRRRRLRARTLRSAKPAQRLALYRASRGALVWGLLLAWFASATFVAMLFPQTTPLGHIILQNGLAIAGIWIVAGLVDRVLAIAIARFPFVLELRPFANAEDRTRQALRVPTIVRAINGFKTFILVFLATLATMTQVGIPVGSVVTIGGVAAIAVSLAAQNLIRDVVSGFLVLSEDQFVVGDYVTINTAMGLVERLTLRMVQIRDGSGSLVTISHSAETIVINHSRNWSRVDYAISIDPAADVQQAIDLVQKTIAELAKDETWRAAVVEALEWVGVDGVSRDGVIIRARIKTAPSQQFAVQRELNLRIVRAFAAAKIAFGAAVT